MEASSQEPQYYAVIFTSKRNLKDDGYADMANRMESLSSTEPGFLGIQSVRGDDGFGITVSYWKSLDDIKRWKSNLEHRQAQALGRTKWYEGYEVRVCKVENYYEFGQI